MKLALFDDYRLGILTSAGLVDVTADLPFPYDPDPLTAGWWRRLCRDFSTLTDTITLAAKAGTVIKARRLRAPVLNPSKIIATAMNYADHVEEMHTVQERTLGRVESWMMNFDIFLKAPSSISGPEDDIVLPRDIVAAGQEIHHESELVIVIGRGGKDIPENSALDHILGYTIGLDITVRTAADRSRRKSYDTFSPVGPWIVTCDELTDASDLDIRLTVGGDERQRVNTSQMITPVPTIVSYASSVMTLHPGDLIFTGAPPGVGPIRSGDELNASVSGIGEMKLRVR